MRSLFKNVANELVQQMKPEDLKEIMDNTIVTVLDKMSPSQRLEFSKEIVNNAVGDILNSLTPQERVELLKSLLPVILTQIGINGTEMEPDELTEVIRKALEG
jgi:Mg/Co/Ni transporter MgtE